MNRLPDLLCLPPAGAGPSLYRSWRMADHVRLLSLPGREARMREPVPENLNALADLLVQEIAPDLPVDYAWFGYSMGATLAFEVTRRLAQAGAPLPRAMFVLASNPPDNLMQDPVPLHSLDGAAFWQELERIGGSPATVLENQEFRELYEPILRADFRNCETYEAPQDGFRLECPVHVFVADKDHMVSQESAEGWAQFTSGPMRLHPLRGRHILDQGALEQLLKQVTVLVQEATVPLNPV